MTAGRATGTIALDRWGRVPVLVATMLVASAGAVLAIFAGAWSLGLIRVALGGSATRWG